MARRLRLQFPGARYHIINRGNFRQAVFASVGAWNAFVRALDEAAERFGWRLYAYAVMSNHYHLALETPEPNLAVGMHWLQTTYASRHNRFRRRQGHLFQGRFKSLLVENAIHLARVIDYIHLNPVRAGIVSAEHIADFEPSSLNRFVSRRAPAWMSGAEFLEQAGLSDSTSGWSRYVEGLTAVAMNPKGDARMTRGAYSAGWAIGTLGWRRTLVKEYAQTHLAPEWSTGEVDAFRRERWQHELGADQRGQAVRCSRGKRRRELS
jgi:REP element-mobilizing transposase RayT